MTEDSSISPAGLPALPRHILLVEDNLDHAGLVIHGFRKTGTSHTIHHVADGEQALGYLFNRGAYADTRLYPRPDLVLLDLRLPRIDGLEVLKTVRETPSLNRIPVVVLTSSDAAVDIRKAYDYHANSYVVKPFDFRQFTQLMKDLAGYWLSWNQSGRQPAGPVPGTAAPPRP